MVVAMAAGFLLGFTFEGMDLAAMAALAALMTFSLAEVPLRGFGTSLRTVPLAFALVVFLLLGSLLFLPPAEAHAHLAEAADQRF